MLAPPEQSRKRCVTIREATYDRLPVLVQPRTTVNTLVGAAADGKTTATGNLRLRSGYQPLSLQGTPSARPRRCMAGRLLTTTATPSSGR
jgi:hypothetical protein